MTDQTGLVRPLFDGPLHLVGDIHGELATLEALLEKLGYDLRTGVNPKDPDRRLVFVGDLVDRGPDSVGVVELVSRLVEAGRAQCVLGNHELNQIRGVQDDKSGAKWFKGQGREDDKQRRFIVSRPVETDLKRAELLAFFRSLPLALEREDLRVVHAHWDQDAIDQARNAESATSLFEAEEYRIERTIDYEGWGTKVEAEYADLGGKDVLQTEEPRPPYCPALAHVTDLRQKNAVKLITGGPETPVDPEEMFFVGGKWRMNRREPWWDKSNDTQAVVVGHYWRNWHRAGGAVATVGDPLEGRDPHEALGKVFVIDYSAGIGFHYRQEPSDRQPEANSPRPVLAALRWPLEGDMKSSLVGQEIV